MFQLFNPANITTSIVARSAAPTAPTTQPSDSIVRLMIQKSDPGDEARPPQSEMAGPFSFNPLPNA
ncbi:MAG TPA: hypothetical protein VF177_17380 [Anaerolineae bacterium]